MSGAIDFALCPDCAGGGCESCGGSGDRPMTEAAFRSAVSASAWADEQVETFLRQRAGLAGMEGWTLAGWRLAGDRLQLDLVNRWHSPPRNRTETLPGEWLFAPEGDRYGLIRAHVAEETVRQAATASEENKAPIQQLKAEPGIHIGPAS
ncbi:hypothetical protein LAZ40_09945 [Cereibacter sphaeroides]|uniref:hypothetical protein n=1 Tax=Cereibacter sphaeroides TaxID=1063 RepID=UPI001F4918BB|nr:hypothetical protein [Cereibacter sphaeroides]MCE6959373.1 hypothetical protein [Cereibacter sphaeroides]MCE6972965.1 hypothetical protein [Cereibacter sphaeroides]